MTHSTRAKLCARLHVMKREQGLDDDLYRDKLEALTGQRSAGDLDDAQLLDAVQRFGQGGGSAKGKRLPKSPQQRLIQALWLSLYNLGAVKDASDAAILAFIQRQTGLDAAQWLRQHRDVAAVVEALKDWLTREGVDWRTDKHAAPYTKLAAYKVALAQWRKLAQMGGSLADEFSGGDTPALALMAHARRFKGAYTEPSNWGNADWAQLNRSLGQRIRTALKSHASRSPKESAA